MANEINWIRSKAKHIQTEMMVISAEDALEAVCEPGTYQIERYSFNGTIPFRMAVALRGCTELVNTDTETETLRIGTGYRGCEGACRYYRTTYKLVG